MPREWTDEARQRQREVALRSRLWEKTARGVKTTWSRYCSTNNCYANMVKLPNAPNTEDDRALLFSASKGLIEVLQATVNQGFQPSEQNLKDFRLAITSLHRVGAGEYALYYGELFKNLVREERTNELSPRVLNPEIAKNLEIAGEALRKVIKQSKNKLKAGKTNPS